MFQYSDQDCCSRARKYFRRECASLLRDFKERAPPALALTKEIRAEHAARAPTFLSTRACCSQDCRGEGPRRSALRAKERIDDVLAED